METKISLNHLSDAVTQLGQAFAKHHYELYLVGGSVRDLLQNNAQAIHDLDFATNAHPDDTIKVLETITKTIWDTGAKFGTISAKVKNDTVEITTYRSDSYTPGSRHPEVQFGDSIEADLSRRDFTCNAIAVSVIDGTIVDPFNGQQAIKDKLLATPIRPVLSFADDPLRMVRLVRFMSTLGFDVAPETYAGCVALAGHIKDISVERIQAEFNKLICGPHVAKALDALCDTGLADYVLPELPALKMEHDPLHHHKDVYTHTMAVIEGTPADDYIVRLAALFHDIGKPATREFHDKGVVSFYQHDIVGARMTRARLRELKYSNNEVRDISELVRLHLRFHGYSDGEWTDSAVRRYVADCETREQYHRLNYLTRADVTTGNKAKKARFAKAMDDLEERVKRLDEQAELEAIRPALDGHQIGAYLGVKPGRIIGQAWDFMKDLALEHGSLTADAGYTFLHDWAVEQGIEPVGERIPPAEKKKKKNETEA